jgi:hypothetical protein
MSSCAAVVEPGERPRSSRGHSRLLALSASLATARRWARRLSQTASLVEALELFFASADPTEVARRLHSEVFVTRVEVAVG